MRSPQVAITTSSDRFERWAEHFRDAGLEPVPLPCIEVRPADNDELARARAACQAADLVLVTSSRAVEVLWPDGELPRVSFAAVGGPTAHAVSAAGGLVEVVGEGGGDDLVDELAGRIHGLHVVFPRAVGGDPKRAARLAEAGAVIEEFLVYGAAPLAPGPDPVDAVVFGSPSAVEGWLLSRTLDEVQAIGAIGDTTAAALAEQGVDPDVVPDVPVINRLAAGLSRALEESR